MKLRVDVTHGQCSETLGAVPRQTSVDQIDQSLLCMHALLLQAFLVAVRLL